MFPVFTLSERGYIVAKIKHRSAGVYEHIRTNLDVLEVVSEFSNLKPQGRGYRGMCPLVEQESQNPAFAVYPDGENWYCYSCQQGGDVVAFWKHLKGFGTMYEAAQDLAREYHLTLPDAPPNARKEYERRRASEERWMDEAKERHRKLLEDTEESKTVRAYYESRGFGAELQERFLLGAVLGSRPSIPYWSMGAVHGCIIRNPEPEIPKYTLPSSDHLPLGRKPLFCVSQPRPITYLLVEGIFDTLAAEAMGIPAIGSGSSQFSAEQIQDLLHLAKKGATFTLLPDDDKAGRAGALRVAEALYPYAKLVAPLPGDGIKDLADLYQRDGAEQAKDTLDALISEAQSALEWRVQQLPSPAEEKIAYLKEHIAPLILQIPSRATQMAVIKEVAKADGLNTDIVKQAVDEHVAATLLKPTPTSEDEDIPADEWIHLLDPGVLDRYVADVCKIHGVVGKDDIEVVKALTLCMVGAQLTNTPAGMPVGSSSMLTGPSGRGKNFVTDAATRAAPPEWYEAFTVASAQAFYWAAQTDPTFLQHKFLYPNEVEAVDLVTEFLRPMLSAGKARKFVTNKNDAGAFAFEEIEVEGPITGVIPTIRNVLDNQLQTRLLVLEMVAYEGMVADQTAALSQQFTPERLEQEDSKMESLWRAALRNLTGARQVVIPYAGHEGFRLSSDDIEAGSRLWKNLLGLLCGNAFLEQKNRKVETIAGVKCVYANAEDYRVAYELLEGIAARSIVNIGELHKKILQALYDLENEDDSGFGDDGFSYRQIAEKAEISTGSISKHRTYLIKSLGMVYAVEETNKLHLIPGLTPSAWEGNTSMAGFPHPDTVKSWEDGTPPPGPVNTGNTETQAEKPHFHAQKPRFPQNEQSGNVSKQRTPKACKHPKSQRVMGNNGITVCKKCAKVVREPPTDKEKEETQQRVWEVFLSFGDKVNNGGVLRSQWKKKAAEMGVGGRDFATAQRRLEKVGKVAGKEYSQQNDQYFYRLPELGEEL